MHLIVVGLGWAGERHVRAVQALRQEGHDVHVVALVDVDPAHRARQAAALGVPDVHADLPAALRHHPDAEAVVIATPHALHREHTEQAARAHRHVLVEKPMALTLEDADAMIAACERAGVTLMVAESLRYQRAPMAIAAALRAGRIGQLLTGRMNMIGTGHTTYGYPGRRSWLGDPSRGGTGIWMLNGIHQMSAVRMFCGEVVEMHAVEVHSRQFQSDLEATVVALLRFDTGVVLTATISAELHGYERFGDVVLFGSDGTLEANWRGSREVRVYTGPEPEIIACGDDERGGAPGHFVRQMEEFLSAISNRREPRTGGRSERASLAAVLAGYESMRTGRPVRPQQA